MVTKEMLKNAYKEMNEALEGVYRQLENIWDYARMKHDSELMTMADNAQHFHGVGECQTMARSFYDDAIRIVEQNEQQKDLPKLLDALRTIENVKNIVNRFQAD